MWFVRVFYVAMRTDNNAKHSCEAGNMTKLFQLISEQFNDTILANVQRKYFNESK